MTLKAKESPLKSVAIDEADQTQGFRNREGFIYTYPASTKGYFDISFPHDIDLLMGDYYVLASADPKNRLWVEIAPNMDLDILAQLGGAPAGSAKLENAVIATDTEIVLNDVAKAALDGFLAGSDGKLMVDRVFFRLGSIPADPMDWTVLKMAKWDSAQKKLVSYSGTFNLTAAAGDKVFVTLRWEDGSYIAPGQKARIGDETIGSSNLPAGTVIRMVVDNVETGDRDIPFNLTYLHN